MSPGFARHTANGMALISALTGATALASMPAPARAAVLGHRCVATEPVGSGWLQAARYVQKDGALGDHSLSWFIPDAAQPQLLRTFVDFSDNGETNGQVDQVRVAFNYNGVPTQPLWLVARMGSTVARTLLWAGPPGSFVAHEWAVRLQGGALQEAYAAGRPLEVYIQRQDGGLEDQRQVALAERASVATRAVILKTTVDRTASESPNTCRPDVISPLPVR